jgi:glycosyltransferase involved in cell wall biosynthesis
MPHSRLILDVSSVAGWAGPPVGMIRVQQELAFAALADRPDIELAVFDPAIRTYRTLVDQWRKRLLGQDAALWLPNEHVKKGWRTLLTSPGLLMMRLERRRLLSAGSILARAIDYAERLAARLPHDHFRLTTSSGDRFDYVPAELALGPELKLRRGDTIVATGYDWVGLNPATIAQIKRATGVYYVATCFDIIPIRYPEFYAEQEANQFRAFWQGVLPLLDRVLAISNFTLNDLRQWSTEQALPFPPTDVVRLGSMTGRASIPLPRPLPHNLEAGSYVLMVGTIEPRKGHELLINLWRDLLEQGIPQNRNFTLVFAGRYGWKMDHLMSEIARLSGEGRLLHLNNVSDDELATLYRNAAFCVLPSVTEGFGLPVVEAFSHGKAIIASTGGSLPEVVAGYSPCLAVTDAAAWRKMIGAWIEDESLRRPYEERIRRSFRQPEWKEVAHDFWQAAERAGNAAALDPAAFG